MPPTESPLLLEARLVERLRDAVIARDAALARALLTEHKQRFPHGQLGPEVVRLRSQLERL